MPAGTRRGSCFLISLDFAYKPQCLLIVTGAAIGPVEADGEHVGRQLMAHRGGVLDRWRDGRSAVRISMKTSRNPAR
jgi:hypothetical protein